MEETLEIDNPFEEEVPDHRKIELARISKHRAGRMRPMLDSERRRRIRAQRARIAAALDAKAVHDGV